MVRRNFLARRRARSARVQPFQGCRMGGDELCGLFTTGVSRLGLRPWGGGKSHSASPPLRHNYPEIDFGVARVSRLIGKSDTTAKRPGWQVYFAGTLGAGASPSAQNSPKRTKRHSVRNGVSLSCTGHWPPRYRVYGGCFHRTYCRFPGRFSLLRAASLAVALAGSCCSLGWPDLSPAAGTSLALILIAIG